MKTTDFYFDLPDNLIAQTPLEDRTASKLMVINKNSGEITHSKFYNIIDYIQEGDCVVLNNTRVIPARLFGQKQSSGGKVEFLLLTRLDEKKWEVLVKPGKKAKVGDKIVFGDGILTATIENIIEDGKRIASFEYDGIWEQVLDKLGEMPLPPYIHEKLEDKERYQTVYSKFDGSAAAPTAGLHFTNELLQQLKNKGVYVAYITLHVGLGTFRPVKVENVLEHEMHSEFYVIDEENANILNTAKKNGGKIISVGTTSTRTLETNADDTGYITPSSGWTNIFIYPGYKFKCVDSLITNFHLPESTLIMLVATMCGKENILNAYNTAVDEKYRFFSFGDAMLITENGL
ncbi:MAG: tRNA preQ1(34) S-adenosylmethionine ribosyltransferase-isomerase QueA [Epulopiscium sp. Nele67-Bin004]|nr:MAG: tRNA preQ1(34) S-adenosylmethionine ribosyltransferase-isomerase QueA [Epulopiscium sp. Nele67-Bin004]